MSNGAFIDNNSMDGFRKCLVDEFTAIYCFNLRGNARTSGEQRRKEKGNVFGEGTRTPVAITLLVKNAEKKDKCKLHYFDIGDYLTREQKFQIITDFGSVKNMTWRKISPNENHDWINKRDPAFARYSPLYSDSEKNIPAFFVESSNGLLTSRDAWIYNYSQSLLNKNVRQLISFYNNQVDKYIGAKKRIW